MSALLFRVTTFPVEGSAKCACVIAGYRGSASSYKNVVDILNRKGFTVIIYEHNPMVLTKGDPSLLIDLVDQICADFGARTSGFNEIICAGASIGAGLCLAIQQRFPEVRYGIYAGAGVSPPESIFEAPLFYFVRKKFKKAGFNETELKKAWKDVDIVPTRPLSRTPFIMVLGKKDRTVAYNKAVNTLQAWKDNGQNIQIITRPNAGHLGVIRWYKRHFSELLTWSEK